MTTPSHWSRMRTFGVRTFPVYSYWRLLAPRKRCRQRSWNVSAYALSPCKRHHSWQCGQKSLPRLHPLPRFHYHHKSCLFSDHYRCHHLRRAHPGPSSFLRRHSHAPPGPLLPHPFSYHHYLVTDVLLQTAFFAVTIFSRRPLFYPFLVATLPLVVVLLTTVSATATFDVPVSPPSGGANSSR